MAPKNINELNVLLQARHIKLSKKNEINSLLYY